MVRAQKYRREEIMNWKKTIRHMTVVDHCTKKEASEILGQRLRISFRTIMNYTSPSVYKAPSYFKKYPRNPNHEYDLRYKHLIRYFDAKLPEYFNGDKELSLQSLAENIAETEGINMRHDTLERLISKFDSNGHGRPLVKTETGNYQLNREFYSD